MASCSIPRMLAATDAIVLSLQPMSDRAHLLHAYTRTGGRVSYKVYGLGRHHAAGLYTPMAVLQITADKSTVRTARFAQVTPSLVTDPYKRAIALFLAEVLTHTLRQPMPDEALFTWLERAVTLLDRSDDPQNFHLQFLIDLAALLGFAMDPQTHAALLRMPGSRTERQVQLRQLCDYFAEHADYWQTPRSLDVLMEIFD